MAKFKGFEGEVSTMEGLDMYNAQGNYDQGRGPDGLSNYGPSRYGTGVPYSRRPRRISGKPRPPAILDPSPYLMYEPTTRETLPVKSPGLIDPGKAAKMRARGYVQDKTGAWVPVVTTMPVPGPPKLTVPWGRGTRAPIVDAILAPLRDPRRRRRAKLSKAAKIRQRQQFINWVKNWAPGLYVAAKKKADIAEGNEGALGALGTWWDSFTDSIKDLGGQYLQYKTQKEILEAQLERMRAGEPPLQTSEYAPTVRIGIDPGTTREVVGAIGAGFGKMLPFIAIGGVALLLMMRRRPRRRRNPRARVFQ
jgi:hypothetical protein